MEGELDLRDRRRPDEDGWALISGGWKEVSIVSRYSNPKCVRVRPKRGSVRREQLVIEVKPSPPEGAPISEVHAFEIGNQIREEIMMYLKKQRDGAATIRSIAWEIGEPVRRVSGIIYSSSRKRLPVKSVRVRFGKYEIPPGEVVPLEENKVLSVISLYLEEP